MNWAWSFYLRKRSLLYKHRRIMSSHLCSEWSFWSSSSKMSKMSIMLIMLTVITSDSNDQSNHFKTLITQWLFNYCCYVITCKRVLTNSFSDWVEMLQNESYHYLLLQFFKDHLTNLCSFKEIIFLSQLYHESSDLWKVLYESLIEIAEINEDLYMSQWLRHFSILNHIYFSRIYLQIIDEY